MLFLSYSFLHDPASSFVFALATTRAGRHCTALPSYSHQWLLYESSACSSRARMHASHTFLSLVRHAEKARNSRIALGRDTVARARSEEARAPNVQKSPAL